MITFFCFEQWKINYNFINFYCFIFPGRLNECLHQITQTYTKIVGTLCLYVGCLFLCLSVYSTLNFFLFCVFCRFVFFQNCSLFQTALDLDNFIFNFNCNQFKLYLLNQFDNILNSMFVVTVAF
jgi:hypothetical protein